LSRPRCHPTHTMHQQARTVAMSSPSTLATGQQNPLLLPGVTARSPDDVWGRMPAPPCWTVAPAGSPLSVCTPSDAACTAWRRLNCPGAPSRKNSMSWQSSDSTPATASAGTDAIRDVKLHPVPLLAGSPVSMCTPHNAACTAWRRLSCPGAPLRRDSMPLPSPDSTPTSTKTGASSHMGGLWLPQSARASPKTSVAAPTPLHLWASAMPGASPRTLTPVSHASSPCGSGVLFALEPHRPTQLLGVLDMQRTSEPSNANNCWFSSCSTHASSELAMKKQQAEEAKPHDGAVVGDGKTPSAWLRGMGA